jgi:hypothetical protein
MNESSFLAEDIKISIPKINSVFILLDNTIKCYNKRQGFNRNILKTIYISGIMFLNALTYDLRAFKDSVSQAKNEKNLLKKKLL